MFFGRSVQAVVSHHLPAVGWAGLVGWLLLVPGDGATWRPAPVEWLFGLSSFWVEILGHLVCFGVLGWLLGRSMRVLGVKRPALVAVGLSTLFGAALEVGQIWIPGRGFQILDLVTNLLGAVVGAWLSRAAGRAKAQ